MKQTLTRLVLTLPMVWLVVGLVYFPIHPVPGNPIPQMQGEGATPADIGALRQQYLLSSRPAPPHAIQPQLGSSIRMLTDVYYRWVIPRMRTWPVQRPSPNLTCTRCCPF